VPDALRCSNIDIRADTDADGPRVGISNSLELLLVTDDNDVVEDGGDDDATEDEGSGGDGV
jgi:hypothetical protein